MKRYELCIYVEGHPRWRLAVNERSSEDAINTAMRYDNRVDPTVQRVGNLWELDLSDRRKSVVHFDYNL